MSINPQLASHSIATQALALVGSVRLTALLVIFGVVAALIGFATVWFSAFVVLLCVNLAAAVAHRLPLNRRQISFAVVHLALICLLAGAWISGHYGFEGVLTLQEGEDTSVLEMLDYEVAILEKVVEERTGQVHIHALNQFELPELSASQGLVLLESESSGVSLEILEARENASIKSSLVAAPEGVGPGVEFQISGKGQSATALLLANHPDQRRTNMGALDVEILNFRRQGDFNLQASASPASSEINLDFADGRPGLHIPLPASIGQPMDAGEGIFVTVLLFAAHARVVDGHLVDFPSETPNPAAEILIEGGGHVERHIVFSQFPDFNIHELSGHPASTSAIRLHTAHGSAKPLLTLLCDPAGRLHTQFSNREGRQAATQLPQSNRIKVADTPFEFALTKFMPNASFKTEVLEDLQRRETGKALLKLRLNEGARHTEFWLELGNSISLPSLGASRLLVFRRQQYELPFRIGLESIDVSYFPGSGTPSSLSSHVLVASTDGSTTSRSLLITENHPLDYANYRMQQVGYSTGMDGAPSASVISVSYNPGVPLLYASFFLLVLGVGWYVLSDGPANRRDKAQKGQSNRVDHIEVVLCPDEVSAGRGQISSEAEQKNESVRVPTPPISVSSKQPQDVR